MKNKLTYLILIATILICIMPLSLAQDYLPHKQNTNFELLISSNNATSCNWTYIQYPDGSKFSSQKVMTKQSTDFNYTINSGNFSQLGSTCLGITCYDEITYESGSVCREVTSTGTNLSTSQSIIYFVFLLASIGLFFLCLYYSIKIPWQHQRNEEGEVIGINDLRYVKMFLVVITYIILMFISGLLRSIIANFIPELGVSSFFEWIFWIMLSCLWPLVIISFVVGIILFLNSKKLQKAIQRGFPIK